MPSRKLKAKLVRKAKSNREILPQEETDEVIVQAMRRKLVRLGVAKRVLGKRHQVNYFERLLITYGQGPMIMIEVQHGTFFLINLFWPTYYFLPF